MGNVKIKLTGSSKFYLKKSNYAKVSSLDADLKRFNWKKSPEGYAYTDTNKQIIKGGGFLIKTSSGKAMYRNYLHRVVAARMGKLTLGQVIDHVNRNRFDDTRSNLRQVTQKINLTNRDLKSIRLKQSKTLNASIKKAGGWKNLTKEAFDTSGKTFASVSAAATATKLKKYGRAVYIKAGKAGYAAATKKDPSFSSKGGVAGSKALRSKYGAGLGKLIVAGLAKQTPEAKKARINKAKSTIIKKYGKGFYSRIGKKGASKKG